MKALHTPGPWAYKDGFQLAVGPEADPEGNAVAVVIGHPGQAFANARLIAASPTLLAALLDVVVWFETYERGECRKTDLLESVNDARAVIAKAEGNQ